MLKACLEHLESMNGAGWEQVERSVRPNWKWDRSKLGEDGSREGKNNTQ
jgi:hypothetical protein